MPSIDTAALNQIFLEAHTHNAWTNQDVPESVLKTLIDTTKMAPTSVNCSPLRVVFVKSKEAKARLKPFLMEGNVEKTMAAPVTAILGYDYKFYDHLPKLFPVRRRALVVCGNAEVAKVNAIRNGTLQAGYFIIAARALGLDCGPMGGFDAAAATNEFFAGTDVHADILVNLGYGDPAGVKPRAPRFTFEEMAKIV